MVINIASNILSPVCATVTITYQDRMCMHEVDVTIKEVLCIAIIITCVFILVLFSLVHPSLHLRHVLVEFAKVTPVCAYL